MTLEQMGFVEERIDNRIIFKRPKGLPITMSSYNEWIEFHLVYKEIEITNIDSIDMMLLEAIYSKSKELFE